MGFLAPGNDDDDSLNKHRQLQLPVIKSRSADTKGPQPSFTQDLVVTYPAKYHLREWFKVQGFPREIKTGAVPLKAKGEAERKMATANRDWMFLPQNGFNTVGLAECLGLYRLFQRPIRFK